MSRRRDRRPMAAARPTAADVVRGTAALALLLALLVGVPAALLAVAGNPLPQRLPSLDEVQAALTAPDDGRLFLTALHWVGWIGWATFAASVAAELPAALRGRPAPHLPALGAQQRAAARLLTAVTVLLPTPALLVPAAHALAPAITTASEHPAGAQARQQPPSAASRPATAVQVAATATPHLPGTSAATGSPQPTAVGAPAATAPPAPTAPITPAAPEAASVTVEAGDTLSALALEHLEDAERYPEIADASRDLTQPDGRRLVDPDLIYPGWVLRVPGPPPAGPDAVSAPATTTSPPPAEDASRAEPPQPGPGATAAADGVPPAAPRQADEHDDGHEGARGAAATADSDSDAGSDADDEADDSDVDGAVSATAAGLSALAAAGVVALLAGKRARQQRHRRRRHRLPAPDPAEAHTERTLRHAQDPVTVDHLDRALRAVAQHCYRTGDPLPALRHIRLLPEHLELHLSRPATPPPGFTCPAHDDTTWVLASGHVLPRPGELDGVPAPFPALASIGHDLDGALLLVNLEAAGVLHLGDTPTDDFGLTGPALVDPHAVLAAIAVDLATAPWTEDTDVVTVGGLAELVTALDTERLTHADDVDQLTSQVAVWADTIRDALTRTGLPGAADARGRLLVPDAWGSRVLLIDDTVSSAQAAALTRQLDEQPRVPLAIVTARSTDPADQPRPDGWSLHCRGDADVATLQPVGVTVAPVALPAQVRQSVERLLRSADQEPLPAAAVTAVPPVRTPPAADDDSGGDERLDQPARPLTDTPTAADPVASAAAPSTTVEDPRAEVGTTTGAPVINVLGPVEVTGARGPVTRASQLPRMTELVTFLALHPHRDHYLLDEALWPGDRVPNARRYQLISRARRWLGADESGAPYLVDVATDGHRLAETVTTDWSRFRALAGHDPATATDEDLQAALSLVRGQPFAGTNPRRYGWADMDRQEMIGAIVDAADELCERAQREGDVALARRAAAVGLTVEPGSEALWRHALRAEHLAGNRDAIDTLADRLTALADELGGDLEPETLEVLNQLLTSRRETPSATVKGDLRAV